MKPIVCLGLLVMAITVSRIAHAEESLPDPKTIAVLDFINRNPADGRDWLGKGLADMIITDLASSKQLVVVDRERVQDLARELHLGESGLLDPQTQQKIGQVAKTRWLLFGTFSCHGDDLSLETILFEVKTETVLRIEQVNGQASSLFQLEEKLVQMILAKLDVPMTEEELGMVRLLKTQSLPAFEHYARCLAWFDQGQWFDALREVRMATRTDPAYLAASMRLAQLFYEIGEPEHAAIEYRRFIEQDRDHRLPAEFYLHFGKILEQAFSDRASAISLFQQFIQRDLYEAAPFRITDPSKLSHGWDDIGGIPNVSALFEANQSRLEVMERLARWQAEAGNKDNAARIYSQLWRWLHQHGMFFGAGKAGNGFQEKILAKYGPLYWQLVWENRDATFFPPGSISLLTHENNTFDENTLPTHGFHHKWDSCGYTPIWLAPPDQEIAEVEYALKDDGSGREKALGGKMAIDFSCMGYRTYFQTQLQVVPDGAWHTVKIPRGVRALHTYTSTDRWQVKFTLRPWSGMSELPKPDTLLSISLIPDTAELIVNGKNFGRVKGLGMVNEPPKLYRFEARWPDGRTRSASIEMTEGKQTSLAMNEYFNMLSRQILAPDGSNPYLLTDRTGRIWLLWDQVFRGRDALHLNLESNLFCATSSDGEHWSMPRRLPVSSLDCDTTPVLQQDRRGVFWLVWVSSRDANAPKSLWIASSPNGIEWSFPMKIVLPPTEKEDVKRWQETPMPRAAFAIDTHNIFWLIWQGWLMRSEDAEHWQVDSTLQTDEKNQMTGHLNQNPRHLFAFSEGLLMTTYADTPNPSDLGAVLWYKGPNRPWNQLGYLSRGPSIVLARGYAGGVAVQENGAILALSESNCGLLLGEFTTQDPQSEPLCIESHHAKPFHPAIATLPQGRFLAVFGSKDGLVAAVMEKAQAKSAEIDVNNGTDSNHEVNE